MSVKKIIRYIGIDFGTSTSVVCYKDYDAEGTPVDHQEPRAVLFENNNPSTPTLVFENRDGTKDFGYKAGAKGDSRPQHLKANFKMDLVGREDSDKRQEAKTLLFEFVRFLYGEYQRQKSLPSGVEVEERTYISFPAKWPPQVRRIMVEAAQQAGFPQVEGLDEPTAAMHYFFAFATSQMQELVRQRVIREGEPLAVLLLDMGAGTTDLVLYRYLPGRKEGHEVLATWPPVDHPGTFGGREVDGRLAECLGAFVNRYRTEPLSAGRAQVLERKCKSWKEGELAPDLGEGKSVEWASPLDDFIDDESLSAAEQSFPPVNRERMGEMLGDSLPMLPRLVNELVKRAVRKGKIKGGRDIDLVLLTGGHSQWYFVKEILEGKRVPGLPRDGEDGSGVHLDKIQREPQRILQSPSPQMTVAKGLAMMGMPVKIKKVLNNNVWLEIKIGLSKTKPILVLEMGEELPCKKGVSRSYQFECKPSKDIPAHCKAYVGEYLGSAIRFNPVFFRLDVLSPIKWIGEFFRLFGLETSMCDADLNFTVNVDEKQHISIKGSIKPGWAEPAEFKIELA